jgi:hypothetical protein
MKSDGDYLWDKTGDPDPEVQQLEEILGTLRYQPRPLEIPAGLSVGRERSFFRGAVPRLAIAATIAILLIGLGVFLALQRSQRSQPPEVAKSVDGPPAKPSPVEQPVPPKDQDATQAVAPTPKDMAAPPRRRQSGSAVGQSFVARNSNRAGSRSRKAKELQEAAAAKDQLLLALRVTSAKLSYAQKKTQSPNLPEPVHNQHKIG